MTHGVPGKASKPKTELESLHHQKFANYAMTCAKEVCSPVGSAQNQENDLLLTLDKGSYRRSGRALFHSNRLIDSQLIEG